MSIRQLLTAQGQDLEGQIHQDIIEVRRVLPQLGYRLVSVYKEARQGRVFCARYEIADVDSVETQALGYLRVSRDMQSNNHSLVTQVMQMMELAGEHQRTMGCICIDAGLTGADSKRPAFQALMRIAARDASRPTYEAVYTYDLYRFYRSLHGLANSYRTLYDNGLELFSVAERHTDLGSRGGKLLVYLRGIMGEMYLDDLSCTVTDNKFTRALKGYSNASVPPYGYCRGTCFQCTDPNGEGYCPRFGSREDLWKELGDDPSVFVPHPIEQHGLVIIADLGSSGDHSDTDIARRLNPPSPDGLEALLQAPREPVAEIEGGRRIVLLQDGTYAIQRASGDLQFFQPKGRPGQPGSRRRFSRDSIRDILQNPFYAGFVIYRKQEKRKGARRQVHKRHKCALGEMLTRQRENGSKQRDRTLLFPGQHIPLIGEELYDRCQRARALRGHNPRNARMKRHVYPLSGLLHCTHCLGRFRGNAGNGTVRYYEDANRANGVSDCPVRSVCAAEVERQVFACAQPIRVPEAWDNGILVHMREGAKWEELRRQRRSIHSELKNGRKLALEGVFSSGEYRDLKRECQRRLVELERRTRVEDACYKRFLRNFSQVWDAATDEERKGLLQCIFTVIWVEDGKIVSYEVREPFIEPLGEAGSAMAIGQPGQVEQLADRVTELTAA
ncbi:MAG: recombinase family protein [Anaerolineae bacterium]|nr:recombinase family protein [Anaerolineae bacterium]